MTLADLPIAGSKPPRGLRMTYEEFLDAQFDHDHYEWVDGEAVEMPSVDSEHADIQAWLAAVIYYFVMQRSLGKIYFEPFHMKTGPDLPGRSPDLFFVKNERLGLIQRKCLRGPADLAIEIISPGSRTRDRRQKFTEYARGGVPEYWLIDPDRKTVEFFELTPDGYFPIDLDEQGRLQSKVFQGTFFNLDWFWSRPAAHEIMKQWDAAAAKNS